MKQTSLNDGLIVGGGGLKALVADELDDWLGRDVD